MSVNKDDNVKELKDYICGYCLYSFKQEVMISNEKNKPSDTVTCPRCTNILKTY